MAKLNKVVAAAIAIGGALAHMPELCTIGCTLYLACLIEEKP